MTQEPGKLIWIDLEMTGLNPATDYIIEIATIITDSALEVVAEGPDLAIHQSKEVLAAMDDWNRAHHQASGLTQRVGDSKYTEQEAERLTLDFVRTHVAAGKSPMCGNSICQDRRFLARYMPVLERHFHYRNLDVSTIKELCTRWAPEVAERFKKEGTHRALQDIRESIDELRHYRRHFLRCAPDSTLALDNHQ